MGGPELAEQFAGCSGRFDGQLLLRRRATEPRRNRGTCRDAAAAFLQLHPLTEDAPLPDRKLATAKKYRKTVVERWKKDRFDARHRDATAGIPRVLIWRE